MQTQLALLEHEKSELIESKLEILNRQPEAAGVEEKATSLLNKTLTDQSFVEQHIVTRQETGGF